MSSKRAKTENPGTDKNKDMEKGTNTDTETERQAHYFSRSLAAA